MEILDAQGRPILKTQLVRVWNCKNCGHWEPQTEQLAELAFKWEAPLVSRTTCPNCGSFTLNKAYDETFKRGEFLVVKTFNKIRGKDNARISTKTAIRPGHIPGREGRRSNNKRKGGAVE